MVFIIEPAGRIGGDVVADRYQITVVADDVFVVVALPGGLGGGVAVDVDVFGGGGFEPRNK